MITSVAGLHCLIITGNTLTEPRNKDFEIHICNQNVGIQLLIDFYQINATKIDITVSL